MLRGNNTWEWGLGFGGWVVMIVLWFLVVLGILHLYKLFTFRKTASEAVIDIFRKKYVQVKISREEFERMQLIMTKD